jgi:hypothetical protein
LLLANIWERKFFLGTLALAVWFVAFGALFQWLHYLTGPYVPGAPILTPGFVAIVLFALVLFFLLASRWAEKLPYIVRRVLAAGLGALYLFMLWRMVGMRVLLIWGGAAVAYGVGSVVFRVIQDRLMQAAKRAARRRSSRNPRQLAPFTFSQRER